MVNSLSRIFLGARAALLLFGGVVHTLAFKKAVAAVAESDLAPFFGKALKETSPLLRSGQPVLVRHHASNF